MHPRRRNLLNDMEVKSKGGLGRPRSRRWLGLIVAGAAVLQLGFLQAFGAFLEFGGKVVIEAEHFSGAKSASGHAWTPSTSVTGFAGASALLASPDSGLTLRSVRASPLLSYSVQITNAVPFNLWIRGWGPNVSGDSVYLGMDG